MAKFHPCKKSTTLAIAIVVLVPTLAQARLMLIYNAGEYDANWLGVPIDESNDDQWDHQVRVWPLHKSIAVTEEELGEDETFRVYVLIDGLSMNLSHPVEFRHNPFSGDPDEIGSISQPVGYACSDLSPEATYEDYNIRIDPETGSHEFMYMHDPQLPEDYPTGNYYRLDLSDAEARDFASKNAWQFSTQHATGSYCDPSVYLTEWPVNRVKAILIEVGTTHQDAVAVINTEIALTSITVESGSSSDPFELEDPDEFSAAASFIDVDPSTMTGSRQKSFGDSLEAALGGFEYDELDTSGAEFNFNYAIPLPNGDTLDLNMNSWIFGEATVEAAEFAAIDYGSYGGFSMISAGYTLDAFRTVTRLFLSLTLYWSFVRKYIEALASS